MMDIALNAEVQCTDGEAGHISHLLFNPAEDKLTHIVVKYHSEEHEVSVDRITYADEHHVRLNCSIQDVKAQPNFIDLDYVRSPLEHRDITPDGYYYRPYVTVETYTVKHPHIPDGDLEFTRGTPVFAKGERIGRIDELVVDPEGFRVTHFVLREGHLWGQKDVVIGVEHVKAIDSEGVHLTLNSAQVSALPTIPLRRRFALAM
jgi:hypothetical protein